MKTKSAKPVGIPSVNFWECWVTFGRWRLSQGSSRHRCFDQSLLSKTPRFQARTNARLQQNFQIHIQYTCGLCYTVCVACQQTSCPQFVGLRPVSQFVWKTIQRTSSKFRAGHVWHCSKENEVQRSVDKRCVDWQSYCRSGYDHY